MILDRRPYCAVLLTLLSACGADVAELVGDSTTDVSAAPDVSSDAHASGDRLADGSSDAPRCEGLVDRDTDGDGLADGVEDRNRDCVADPDETDWQRADTDGDGLSDGAEDLDGDGSWDADTGELDPRRTDSDGDGLPDGEEAAAVVCVRAATARDPDRVAVGDHDVAVPGGARVIVQGARHVLIGRTERDFAVISVDAGAASRWRPPSAGAWMVELRAASGPTEVWRLRRASGLRVDAATVFHELGVPDGAASELPRDAFAAWVAEVEVATGSDLRRSVAVSAAERPQAEDWLGLVSAESISAEAPDRLAAACAVADRRPSRPLRVIVAGDTTAAGHLALVGAVEEVFAALEQSAVRDVTVHVVPGDGHVAARPGTELGAFVDSSAAVDLLSGLPPGDPDQRLWMNVRSWLEASPPPTADEQTLVVVAINREDTEFRQGTANGYDGHPFAEALPAGADRDSLTRYYAAVLGSPSVRLVAVARGNHCAEGVPSSAGDIAVASDGVFVDACATDADLGLMRAAIVRGITWDRRVEWRQRPVGPAARTGGLLPVPSWEPGLALAVRAADDASGAASLQFWTAAEAAR